MSVKRNLLEKIRVPGLVEGAFPPAPHLSLPDSIQLVTQFLKKGKGKTTIMTGAGVSVDSGIRVTHTHFLSMNPLRNLRTDPKRAMYRLIEVQKVLILLGNIDQSSMESSLQRRNIVDGIGRDLICTSPSPFLPFSQVH